MACKVIAAGRSVQARPVFPAAHHDPEPRRKFAEEPREDNAELTALRRKVVELEAALSREVARAHDAGRKEGEAAGRELGKAEISPAVDRLTRAISDLSSLRARLRRESESDLVKLSLCVARRILRRELTVDPDAVQGLVRAALDKTQARDLRRVRVHPDLQVAVRKHVEKAGIGGSPEIVPDNSLQPGDVVVETRLGDVDASIDSQLREIERGFADRLSRNQ